MHFTLNTHNRRQDYELQGSNCYHSDAIRMENAPKRLIFTSSFISIIAFYPQGLSLQNILSKI